MVHIVLARRIHPAKHRLQLNKWFSKGYALQACLSIHILPLGKRPPSIVPVHACACLCMCVHDCACVCMYVLTCACMCVQMIITIGRGTLDYRIKQVLKHSPALRFAHQKNVTLSLKIDFQRGMPYKPITPPQTHKEKPPQLKIGQWSQDQEQ